MNATTLRLLAAASVLAAGACSAPEEPDSQPSEPAAEAMAEAPRQTAEQPEQITYPDVSRTGTGNGGVVALAGVATFEFDFESNRCKAAPEEFSFKGIEAGDGKRKVSLKYAEVVDPGSGRKIATAVQFDVRTGDDENWATYQGSGMAGKVAELSQTESAGGGSTLTLTGVASGFHNNGAPLGRKVPFRLEATCE